MFWVKYGTCQFSLPGSINGNLFETCNGIMTISEVYANTEHIGLVKEEYLIIILG